jgi:RNA polymerase sigma factor (sigma-70 family)
MIIPEIAVVRKSTRERADARLVKQCLAGREEAWSALIDKYKALIFSIPVKYRMDRAQAADVFQAVCMELLASLGDLRDPGALPKWLMQIAHHECYRVKRQQQRFVSRDAEPDLPEPPLAESLVEQAQREQILREAIAELSPQCRQLVAALFFETPARPYAEIAAALGLATGSIGFTRQKCIERLRRSLQKMGFV